MFGFKRRLLIAVAAILSLALLDLACVPTKVEEVEEVEKVERLEIVLASYLPPAYTFAFNSIDAFVDEIYEESEGKITFDIHHSSTLLGAKDSIPGLLEGVADVVTLPTIYVQASYPLLTVVSLPLIWDDTDHFVRALKFGSPLYNMLNEELARFNLYGIFGPADTSEMFWSRIPIRTPADLEGLNVRCSGELAGKETTAYGGSPVSMPSGEMYLALERGVLDVAFASVSTARSRAIYELVEYATYYPFHYYGGFDLYWRLDWLEGLPKPTRDIILEATKAYQAAMPVEMDKFNEEAMAVHREGGVEFLELTPAEVEVFKELAIPIWDWFRKRLGVAAEEAIGYIEAAR